MARHIAVEHLLKYDILYLLTVTWFGVGWGRGFDRAGIACDLVNGVGAQLVMCDGMLRWMLGIEMYAVLVW